MLPEYLKNSPLLIGAGAFSMVFVTSAFLSLEPNASWIVVPLVTVSVYEFDDLAGAAEDAINQPHRDALTVSSRQLLGLLVAGAYATALGLALAAGSVDAVALAALPGISGVAYSVPSLPFTDGTRLKDVLGLNTAIVAGTWAVVMTFLPIALAPTVVPWLPATLVAVFWFLRVVVATETCNVPDVVGDRQSGVATIPAEYGLRSTQRFLYAIDLLSVGVVLAITWTASPAVSALVVLPVVAYSTCCTYMLGGGVDRRLICGAADAQDLLMAGAVAVALIT